jgi:hypothetical protein
VQDHARPSNCPFSLTAIGHARLRGADHERVRLAVEGLVADLRACLPATDLRLLVALGGSADLLIAQTAAGLGIELEVTCCGTLHEALGVQDAPARAAWSALLSQPRVMPVVLQWQDSPLPESGPAVRDARAVRVLESMLRRSGLLVAVWDGADASGAAAGSDPTAGVVLSYLRARSTAADSAATDLRFEEIEADEDEAAGDPIVYWIPAGDPAAGGAAAAAGYLRGAGEGAIEVKRSMPTPLRRMLADLDDYNRAFESLPAERRREPVDSLLRGLSGNALAAADLELERVDAEYGKADALAVHYQRQSDRLFILFGVLAFTMGLAYLVYDKLAHFSFLLMAYVAGLVAGLVAYYLLRGRRWFTKHLIYRALAETLRATFYLRLAGIDHRVDAGRVLALSAVDRFDGFSLISQVLAGVAVRDVHAVAVRGADDRAVACIERNWLDSQYRYFVRKVASIERSGRRVGRLKRVLVCGMFVLIVAMFGFDDRMEHYRAAFGVSLKNLVTFVLGLLALLLGVWQLHEDKMASRELLWQYRSQRKHFDRARRQLARLSSVTLRNEVLVDLARDSLMESYRWILHRYHREHEPPTSG